MVSGGGWGGGYGVVELKFGSGDVIHRGGAVWLDAVAFDGLGLCWGWLWWWFGDDGRRCSGWGVVEL